MSPAVHNDSFLRARYRIQDDLRLYFACRSGCPPLLVDGLEGAAEKSVAR
jgi:hypothetical protein